MDGNPRRRSTAEMVQLDADELENEHGLLGCCRFGLETAPIGSAARGHGVLVDQLAAMVTTP